MCSKNFQVLEYDSVYLARALRSIAFDMNISLNMTQIHKMLYVAYGTALVYMNSQICKEIPAAWPYGPVFPRVQKQIKLTDDISDTEKEELKTKNNELYKILLKTVSRFGKIPATKLSAWSHEKYSPWDLALTRCKGAFNTKLDNNDIKSYFSSL